MTDGIQEHDLPDRIAADAGIDRQQVLRTFHECNLPLATGAALPRPLQVHRLRIAGDRTVNPAGPFDQQINFGSGVTALVAHNLKGKTSVLELITWCVRGSHRDDLQGVVKSWLSHLDCDAVVAGRPLGFRLRLDHGEVLDARVLSAPSLEQLREASVSQPGAGVRELLAVQDETAYADGVAALMLDLMNLGRLETASAQAASGTAMHGWPAYFGAIYLPAGGDRVLLGDVAMGGLAGRLLQVFLDLPSAALLTQVKALRDARAAASKADTSDLTQLRALQAEQYEQTRHDLGIAQDRLAALADDAPTESVRVLASSVATIGRQVVQAEGSVRDAQRAHDVLRGQRQADEKALNDLRESAIARALFHALDPIACPRCETPVTRDRKEAEQQSRTCAVCSAPVAIDLDDASGREAEREAEERLKASRVAEQAAKDGLAAAQAVSQARSNELAETERLLESADQAAQTAERAALTAAVARLEGMLSVLAPPEPPQVVRDDTQRVLSSAAKILDAEGTRASTALFDELNAQIVELARRFGMADLDRVKIDRGARLQVWKTGGPREWFKYQDPGERLRLRIAVVVALLRVGAKFGLATHPGLLMIDSPKAEEVQDIDATALFTEFEQLAKETAGLQIIFTSSDEPLVRHVLTESTIVAPPAPGQPLW